MTAFNFLKKPNRRVFLKSVLAGLALPVSQLAAQELKINKSVKLIAEAAGLSGSKSIVVMDAVTGQVLESYNGDKNLPPASVAKAATALYALSALGPASTFTTRLLATGPIENGVLKGDLILQGAGDPRLDTDALGSLAEQLKARGVNTVRGKFYVYAGALPYQRQIDPDQLDYVGYNPTIHGINLNFNRVYFKWKRGAQGYILSLLAQAKKYAPEVFGIKISVKGHNLPVFTYKSVNGSDHWTVAQSALGKAGSRWLPVRYPADYAGEVFRTVAALNGIRMPKHKVTEKPVSGNNVAVWESGSILALSKSMIKYSTNMTAETLGMNATVKRGKSARSLRGSAQAMTKWLEAQYGVRGARFVDHSGLGSDSRISAHEMARFLVNAKWDGPLRPIMKEITLRNAKWQKAPIGGAKIVVKTGTLNFASALAGYVTCPNGRKLVFAVFTADMKKRAKIAKKDRERPPGTKAWARRSRVMQHQLVRHWLQVYGT
jgi:D-alanyl-D-alanine carboxypeptidase/D-alanyl-D-alanine-endopeptidase (penicillin-binding protein 4)